MKFPTHNQEQEEWDYYFPPKLQVSSSSRPTSEEKPAIDHDVLQISDDENDEKADHSNMYDVKPWGNKQLSPSHTWGYKL